VPPGRECTPEAEQESNLLEKIREIWAVGEVRLFRQKRSSTFSGKKSAPPDTSWLRLCQDQDKDQNNEAQKTKNKIKTGVPSPRSEPRPKLCRFSRLRSALKSKLQPSPSATVTVVKLQTIINRRIRGCAQWRRVD